MRSIGINRDHLIPALLIASGACITSARCFALDNAAMVDFFESRIRPVLIDQCYSCHNSADAAEGGLAVDHRQGLLNGGDSGPAIVPGSPDDSLLLRALRHADDAPHMPQDAPKLSDQIIADFERWIAEGAIDPRDQVPSAEQLSQLTSWEAIRERRKHWWSFRPIEDHAPPAVSDQDWSDHPIDRFILAKLESSELVPAPSADRRTLIRRISYALTGLPPTPQQLNRFLTDDSLDAYERLVDDQLASEHFGERWARHWMDWIRYAETHGSEGDPAIPFAWRYRDYLIRAMNADVPYDQLVREHIAGDLLPDPRINKSLGINESMLGTAQYRFVQHGFAPTDALDEQVRFTDNQIDVISKAFLGLTVSCARCHNHKFDPISQRDFYALYGIMVSNRPATVTVDTPQRQDLHRQELTDLKQQIKGALVKHWLAASDSLTEKLLSPDGLSPDVLKQAEKPAHPLHAWLQLRLLTGEEFAVAWNRLREEHAASRERLLRRSQEIPRWRSHLSAPDDSATWYRHGSGLRSDMAFQAGEFAVDAEGDRIVAGIYPAGVHSNLLSSRHSGVLTSPRIHLDAEHLYLRVRGDGEARARYVVQHYPRRGTVYPIEILTDGRDKWIHWDVTYWQGDDIYLEITTAADMPVESKPDAVRSSFGVMEAVLLTEEQRKQGLAPVNEMSEFATPLFDESSESTPTDFSALAELYAAAVRSCVVAWRDNEMTDEQARFLNAFVQNELLPQRTSDMPSIQGLIDSFRKLEAEIPVPTRAPGVLEADIVDQPFFPRGNHKQPGEPVARSFIEAIDDAPYDVNDSGRLELANDLLRDENPFAARVIVNRVWHHLFGRGLVATPDNFGHLGIQPSHPELLDWLAARFIEDGWSVKRLIRRIVTSQTYRLDSSPSELAGARDPDNLLLSHAPVRRLEAESIRDAMLAAAGELDARRYGPPDADKSRRRSVYLRIRRNDMIPLLTVFDQPTPFSTQGRRDVTNVPGQSLTLMNDPFVNDVARQWAERMLHNAALQTDEARIEQMFVRALGRPPTEFETRATRDYLATVSTEYAAIREQLTRTSSELQELRRHRQSLIDPVRERLSEKPLPASNTAVVDLRPIAAWEFDEDLSDSIGSLHGTSHGKAAVQDGALVLDGSSYVVTQPLDRELREKTLEAWVQLDSLDQRGGGAMSVQSTDGSAFDAIVFGERRPRHWLAGSDHFRRTRDFGGQDENAAEREPVHVAIVYHADGRIAGYRNGEPYGQIYHSSGLRMYAARESVMTFGLRHLPAGGNRFLMGRIHHARLYDRALSDAEVAAAARDDINHVSLAAILNELTPEQRQTYDRLSKEIEQTMAREEQLATAGKNAQPERGWQELAMTLFNLKEFIYVR